MSAVGTLFLVVGASGVGKDTLIAGARRLLADAPSHVFPARHITRPADAGGERHVAVSDSDFASRRAAGGYALSWRAHDLSYGIPASILQDLLFGRHVVVNVSRSVLARARVDFPSLRVINVTAPAELLAVRLRRRGRETEAEIEARIRRADSVPVAGADVIEIRNDGAPEIGIVRLVATLAPELEPAM